MQRQRKEKRKQGLQAETERRKEYLGSFFNYVFKKDKVRGDLEHKLAFFRALQWSFGLPREKKLCELTPMRLLAVQLRGFERAGCRWSS